MHTHIHACLLLDHNHSVAILLFTYRHTCIHTCPHTCIPAFNITANLLSESSFFRSNKLRSSKFKPADANICSLWYSSKGIHATNYQLNPAILCEIFPS